MNYDFATLGDFVITMHDEEPEEAGPEIPFEIHNPRPISAELAMQEVRVSCGGHRTKEKA